MNLAPGTYSVTASLEGDPGIGYRNKVEVKSGVQTSLLMRVGYSIGAQITHLQTQRSRFQSTATRWKQERHNKGVAATVLTLLALAGGAASYFTYETGSTAYKSYEAAMTATSAQTYRQQVLTYGTIAIASGVTGGAFLIWGLGELGSRPSQQKITSLDNSIAGLDAQIQALKAREQLPK